MGDVSRGLSYDPTFDVRSPSPRHDKFASPSGRRHSDIHIPSPDHNVSVLSSEHFDKAGLVAAQEAALHDAAILEMGWTGGDPDEYAFMPEGEKPLSPAVGSLQDLKSLRPIRLRNMKIGKVHRGRILSGTLCCKSVKIFAIMNVLEEEGTGDATKLVISNAVPRSATTATAQRLYPEGAQLSVREPYLKRFTDGMVGILVENPNDIIFNYLPDALPSPVSERENLLWPVYKDPCGDAPDTPVFNTYGSFLSSPSLLSRNSLNSPSLNSPSTPRSPRNFLDDPMDGLTIRTIRKFRSFRKHDQGSEHHEDAAKVSPISLRGGDDGLSSPVESVGSAPDGRSFDESKSTLFHAETLADLSEGNHEEGHNAEESSKSLPDEGLQTRIGQIEDSHGLVTSGDPCLEEPVHASSPTGGLVSEFNRVVTNSAGILGIECKQPDTSGKYVSRSTINDNLHTSELAGEAIVDSFGVGDACAPQCIANESLENGSTDFSVIEEAEETSRSCTGTQVDSEEVVDVEDDAVVIGLKDCRDSRPMSSNSEGTEGIRCHLPPNILPERSNGSESATVDGLEASVLASSDSDKKLVNTSVTCNRDSVSQEKDESEEACVGAYPTGAHCVAPEGGSEIRGSQLLGHLGRNLPETDLEKTGTVEVELVDGAVAAGSSTTSVNEPRADSDDKSEFGLQMTAHLSFRVSCGSEVKLDSKEADLEGVRKDTEDPAHSTDAHCYASASEQGELSTRIESDYGTDTVPHQTEVHEVQPDFDRDKGLVAPIKEKVDMDHSLSYGSGRPAGETNESESDSKGSKSPQTVDPAVEEEPSAAALRMKGNQRFARQDWNGAIELYTRAVHKAVQESNEQMISSKSSGAHHANGNGVETEMEVVMDYSNRAEAWLRLHHYERAWADAERALSIDPKHLKSLFRKGRALLGLGDYQQALTHLESAYARAPFDKDLLAAIKLSRIGDHQSRRGLYELTDYYLRGRFAGEIPSCADYVGPIEVKKAGADKGRGLFLTKHVEAGDLLLVSNPLAMLDSMCTNKNRKNLLDHDAKGRLDPEVRDKLVHVVRERAKISTKNRRRLSALCYGEDSAEQPIPSMDLFIPGRRVAPAESWNLEEEHITHVVLRNAIDRNMVSTPLEKRRDPTKGNAEDHQERVFWGLWVLPGFINHSCIPNVSLVVIGRALFVYASRDLSAGEELVCSYFNVFQPLPQRQEVASRCWGFTCKCARCLLETRFESILKNLYSLHSELQPNPEFVLQLSPHLNKEPAKDLAKELEVIEVTKKLDHRERCWLQASFTQLYACAGEFMGPHGNYHYLEAALHAMQVVCPGSSSTLEVGRLVREKALKDSNGKKTFHYKGVNQQVLRICQCIYGKQKTAVLQSLVEGKSI